MVLVLVPLRT